MKLKNIINTCMVAAALLFAACSPDEYSLDKPDLQPEDLVAGVSFLRHSSYQQAPMSCSCPHLL